MTDAWSLPSSAPHPQPARPALLWEPWKAQCLPSPHPRQGRQRPAAPRARTVSRIRFKGKVRKGSRDAIAGLGAGTGAGRLRLPEASEAWPLGWLILSWGGSGWRGILSNLPFGSYSLRAGPQTGFSGWGAGCQVRSGDALAGSCWLSQLQRGRVTKVGGGNHPFFWDSRVLGPEYSCLCVHPGHGLWRTGPLRYGSLPGSAASYEIAVACKKRKATLRGFCQGLGRARMGGKLRLVGGDGGSRPRGSSSWCPPRPRYCCSGRGRGVWVPGSMSRFLWRAGQRDAREDFQRDRRGGHQPHPAAVGTVSLAQQPLLKRLRIKRRNRPGKRK